MFIGVVRTVRRRWVPAATVAVMAGAAGLVGVGPATAETSTVVNCDDYPSALQPVIDGAAPGETLVVLGTCYGPFTISQDLTLVGLRHATLDGNRSGSTVTVTGGARVRLKHLTITNGEASGYGGGIANYGTLTVSHCAVSDNSAMSAGTGHGGGIHNGGTLTVTSSTLRDNRTAGAGGGINNNGVLTVNRTAVYGNSADSGGGIFNYIGNTATVTHSRVHDNVATNPTLGGGGINNFANGALTLSDSAVYRNTAPVGGGVENDGAARLIRSAVARNTATNQGGGIYNRGTATVTRSVVRRNTAGGGSDSGGGIYNQGGTVTLTQSRVRANTPDNCAPPGSVPGCIG